MSVVPISTLKENPLKGFYQNNIMMTFSKPISFIELNISHTNKQYAVLYQTQRCGECI